MGRKSVVIYKHHAILFNLQCSLDIFCREWTLGRGHLPSLLLAKNMVLTTPPSGRFQRNDVCDAEPQVPSDVV